MTTLVADISASDRVLLVAGDTTSAVLGRKYAIDDEIVVLDGSRTAAMPA